MVSVFSLNSVEPVSSICSASANADQRLPLQWSSSYSAAAAAAAAAHATIAAATESVATEMPAQRCALSAECRYDGVAESAYDADVVLMWCSRRFSLQLFQARKAHPRGTADTPGLLHAAARSAHTRGGRRSDEAPPA